MHLRPVLQPLTLAALATIAAVAVSMRWLGPSETMLAWVLLGGFSLLFLVHEWVGANAPRAGHVLLVLLALLALGLLAVAPRVGTAQVLLVIWVAGVVGHWPRAAALAAIATANIAAYLILRESGHPAPLVTTLLYLGFQTFAALCTHYATSAERARDRLAQVNADLLATRALLAESTRDSERLRMARELHDVAGHGLTALLLNLRALADDPATGQREELRASQRLASGLLGDLRDIVQAMRDARGLDLATALQALAAPLPKTRLQVDLDPALRIHDTAVAEAILRIVQEALTNAARHGGATTVRVAVGRAAGGVVVTIDDDGHLRGPLREGNGLAGMRERVLELGGQLRFARSERGALRIEAELPA